MPENYGQSATRHFADAQSLAGVERWDGAGHLIGFSAECALKHGVLGFRQEIDSIRGHFPELIEVAKRQLQQRRQTGLYTILKNAQLMSGWAVDMRYYEDGSVSQETYELWKQQAYTILHAAGIKRTGS